VAVIGSGGPSMLESAPEGGVLLVAIFEPEPIASAGEAPAGAEVGAGVSVPAPPAAVPAPRASVVAPIASIAPPEPARHHDEPRSQVTVPVVAVSRAPVLEPPAFLVREEPTYPARARRAGAEGRAVLRVSISAEGEVTAVVLQETSGSAALDEAAMSAARASRFTPARRDGVAEPSEAVAAYRFELR
ncbi:MAG: TonB family protein, partial [Opitutales bacterium]